MPQQERALIDAVERRLADKYSALPRNQVAAAVQQAYERLGHSRVREFAPLLVERRATKQLAASGSAATTS